MKTISYDRVLSARLSAMSPDELDAFGESCLGTLTLSHGEEVPDGVMFPGSVAGRRDGTHGFTVYFVDPARAPLPVDMSTETLTPVKMTKAERDRILEDLPMGQTVPRIAAQCLDLDGIVADLFDIDGSHLDFSILRNGPQICLQEPQVEDCENAGRKFDDLDAALWLASQGETFVKVPYADDPEGKWYRLLRAVPSVGDSR